MSAFSAAGALLWMTHTLLKEHGWAARDVETDTNRLLESFVGDVNLLPTLRYQLSEAAEEDADVHVRGLLVGSKLFVHFVSSSKSVQLRLKISEFVKPRHRDDSDQGRACVLIMDTWQCNLEILRWRLERNLFPEFSGDTNAVASDAELSRLPEALLVRIGVFLSAPEVCRVTQTSKYLHQLQDSLEMWQQLLGRDFPPLRSESPKAVYISNWTQQKLLETWERHRQEYQRLHYEHLFHPQRHWWSGRVPAHPLHVLMPPPFLPLGGDPFAYRPPRQPPVADDILEMLQDYERNVDSYFY
ncbi:hypothetical protein GN958_ATG08884 [Phytophthora infestans]|uniref:F-box domain-containing protein n=1 Tax=Phytophthora infestans TaxID=4787 RepID=A0A8S9UM85_PHYIN|nr:hypothetical protein GN958_ATG08884 [Phytophthora infestans]